jgi:tetratricopeptide (TPR) repeat protein
MLREGKLGPQHPDTLMSRDNLAYAYFSAGRPSEAISLLKQTLPVWEATLGADHADTLECRISLASAYEALGRWSDAEGLYRDTLARRRRVVKPDDPLLADDLCALGHHLMRLSRWSEAEPPLREAQLIRQKATPHAWQCYEATSLLGGVLLGQGRYAEAERLVVEGYQRMKDHEAGIYAPDRFRLREAAERVVRLYQAWNKPDQAAAWKANLGMPDLPAEIFATP